ncbi:MAG: zf-TFIIB domain-containing protein [Pseudomonadota bacterium]
MQCPKCPGTLESKTYGRKISVRRCDQCAGMFLKPEVLLEMKREWMSEIVLDSGNPKVGRALNEVDDILCPECAVPMDKTVDAHQTHIWLETCSQCEGLWLDAGEFSDLKYDTLLDRVRDFVTGPRPG